jgi:AcrR family transcriptional regulator
MNRHLTTLQKPRKKPQQARSRHMQQLIHAAAARVLEREGPAEFNTNRVAEVAGISIGSLYQYYPNKTALLLALHEEEIYATWAAVQAELCAPTGTARERMARAIRHFFLTEAEEAPLRALLADAAVALSETEAFAAQERRIADGVRRFLAEALGRRARRVDLDFETELVLVTVSSVAEHLTRDRVRGAELEHWAQTLATMLADRLRLE